MHINDFDAMRWLGADPRKPASDIEAQVMIALHNRVVAEHERMAKRKPK